MDDVPCLRERDRREGQRRIGSRPKLNARTAIQTANGDGSAILIDNSALALQRSRATRGARPLKKGRGADRDSVLVVLACRRNRAGPCAGYEASRLDAGAINAGPSSRHP